MSETFVTLEQRPDLIAQVRGLTQEVWAEFLHHDAVCNRYWRLLYSTFARFQVVLCGPADTVTAEAEVIEARADKPITRLRCTARRSDGTEVLRGECLVYTMLPAVEDS